MTRRHLGSPGCEASGGVGPSPVRAEHLLVVGEGTLGPSGGPASFRSPVHVEARQPAGLIECDAVAEGCVVHEDHAGEGGSFEVGFLFAEVCSYEDSPPSEPGSEEVPRATL